MIQPLLIRGILLPSLLASSLSTSAQIPAHKASEALATPSPSVQQPAKFDSQIPTVILQLGGGEAMTPDWSKISFATLPPLSEAGSLGELSWRKGERLEEVMRLEDFEHSFDLQDLSLFSIGLKIQVDPKTIPLSQFKLLQHQTIEGSISLK